jgi:uracil-DNA glycosylase
MSEAINPQIEESWKKALGSEFGKEYFIRLRDFLHKEKSINVIYPPGQLIFSAFNRTPVEKVKAVILGQDPYHGQGQANGLCFSVSDGIPHPPSLINIFKELEQDLGIPYPRKGNLEPWADQGVLLLNATLTVRAHQAGSHQGQGWESFTDAAIRAVSENTQHVVFMLWGNFARQKKNLIDTSKHAILECGHPSPMSANRGLWFGNRHFSKANQLLKEWGREEIDWRVE